MYKITQTVIEKQVLSLCEYFWIQRSDFTKSKKKINKETSKIIYTQSPREANNGDEIVIGIEPESGYAHILWFLHILTLF